MDAILNFDYSSLYSALLLPFTHEAFGPQLATILLLLAFTVLLGFLCFAVPQAIRLQSAISAIAGGSTTESESQKRTSFQDHYQSIDARLLSNKLVAPVWQEFRKTLIFPTNHQPTAILATSRPQHFFNPRTLHVQYDFITSLPNFFVGLGLLGTFIGLIAALTFSTKSLTTAVDQDQIKGALNQLLTTAAAKFYISAAGLVASLVLSLIIKLVLKRLHSKVHTLNNSLEERLLFVSEQTITEKQLSVQKDSLDELKLFNTNIAMKIGDAVRTAVQSSNDQLTAKLSDIADSFSKLISASGEGAGKAVSDAMKGALDASLREASEAMSAVAVSMKDLPAQLKGAALEIQSTGSAATQEHRRLAEDLQKGLDELLRAAATQLSGSLEHGTRGLVTDLKNTGSTFGASAERISTLFEKFSAGGDDYIKSLSSLTTQNAALQNGLSEITSNIASASDGVAKASSAIGNNMNQLLNGLGDFGRISAEAGQNMRDFQNAIRNTVDTLQQQMLLHIQRFDSVDQKLATVFNSISTQLEVQSREMSEQLGRMDQALAAAVNQFEQLIEDLTDAMSRRRVAG